MANVLDLMGYVANISGGPLAGKTATLKNNATGATVGSPTTTDADGKWEFANQDEANSYYVEVAMGGSSTQVVSRRPWSGEMLSLYVRNELRTNSGATVAFGGAISVGGALTVSTGGISVQGNSLINGTLTVNSTLGSGAHSVTGALTTTTTVTAATGLRATAGGCIVTAGGLTVSAGGAAITGNGTLVGTLAVGAAGAASAAIHARATAAGSIAGIFQGAVSQTANLLSALDSTGATLAAITAAGLVYSVAGVTASTHMTVGATPANYHGGEASGFVYIANRGGGAAGNPIGGGWLYVEGGALKYKGSSGTVTTIANA